MCVRNIEFRKRCSRKLVETFADTARLFDARPKNSVMRILGNSKWFRISPLLLLEHSVWESVEEYPSVFSEFVGALITGSKPSRARDWAS